MIDAISNGTISKRLYFRGSDVFHENSENLNYSPIYNIHSSLYKLIRQRNCGYNIYAETFPKAVANANINHYREDWYEKVKLCETVTCMRYKKYYIRLLSQKIIENRDIMDMYDNYGEDLRPVILILDNYRPKTKIEVFLDYEYSSIKYLPIGRYFMYFAEMGEYIYIMIRRRRKSIIIHYRESVLDILIKCFSPFINKNNSRLAMYYV